MTTKTAAAREAARHRNGEFGTQDHSAPEMALAAPNDDLDKALSAWELTAEDLPGITEAWAEMFGQLNAPAPESALDAEWHGLDSLTIERVIPRADFSLEIHVEAEDDDGYADTYRVHLDPEAGREFLLAQENADTIREHERLTSRRAQYVEGTEPVWHVLTGEPQNWLLATHVNNVHRAELRLTDSNHVLGHVAAFRNALNSMVPLPKDYGTNSGMYGSRDRGISPLSPPEKSQKDRWGGDTRKVKVSEVNECAEKLSKAVPEHEKVTAAFAEAKALPDGPLKDFLLGTRETKHYQSNEGTDRRPKIVKRSYTPKSELQTDHAKAVEKHTAVTKERNDILRRLNIIQKEHTVASAETERELQKATAERDKVWAAGYNGPAAKFPAYRPNPNLSQW